ncbi:hypothetical protein GCM10010522_32750 [Kribbella solani]
MIISVRASYTDSRNGVGRFTCRAPTGSAPAPGPALIVVIEVPSRVTSGTW